MTEKTGEAVGRRDFLKFAGTAAPLVAAVTVAGTTAEAAEPDLESGRMQDTAHTRAYYDSARF
jgi:hypothetical protein